MSSFKHTRDSIVSDIDEGKGANFTYPLKKIGSILGGYPKGELLVVGGRRTSGKSYFILNNYVINPLIQEIKAAKIEDTLGLNLIYISNKKPARTVIERMVVNLTSNLKKGNKVGTPSLYSTQSISNKKISKKDAKGLVVSASNIFLKLEEKKKLHLITSKFSVDSLKDTVHDIMTYYGIFNGDHSSFTYSDSMEDTTTIIVIDDATGVYGIDGQEAIKNAAAMELASMLRDMARRLNALIVIGVPSSNDFYRDTFYKGYLSALSPYINYADRVITLHNPLETSDMKPMQYELNDFINPKTGINYFRFINILANHSGPSNVMLPLFMYPENGYFIELPSMSSQHIDKYYDKVLI